VSKTKKIIKLKSSKDYLQVNGKIPKTSQPVESIYGENWFELGHQNLLILQYLTRAKECHLPKRDVFLVKIGKRGLLVHKSEIKKVSIETPK
jgi:hypothetical protein